MAIKNTPKPAWVTVSIHGDGTPNGRVMQMHIAQYTNDGFKHEVLYFPNLRTTEIVIHGKGVTHDPMAFFYDNGDFVENFTPRPGVPPYIDLRYVANVAYQTAPDEQHGNQVSVSVIFRPDSGIPNFTIYTDIIYRDYRFETHYASSHKEAFEQAYREEVERFAPKD